MLFARVNYGMNGRSGKRQLGEGGVARVMRGVGGTRADGGGRGGWSLAALFVMRVLHGIHGHCEGPRRSTLPHAAPRPYSNRCPEKHRRGCSPVARRDTHSLELSVLLEIGFLRTIFM